jgi:hypothetical protein
MRALHLALLSLTSAGLLAAGCKSDGGGGGTGGTGGGQGGGAGGGLLANCPQNFPDDLISDFEADNSIAAVDGRQGGWYTYGDDAGTFTPSTGYEIAPIGNPGCSPNGSLHVKATGFALWGAAAGTDFKPRAAGADGGLGRKATYDATKYRGIAFWAKGSAAIMNATVKFPDVYQDPEAAPTPGDACLYTPGSLYNCSPYLVQFGRKGDAAVDALFSGYMNHQIDTTWKRFEVLFADTKQDPGNPGFSMPPADKLAVDKLAGMAIQMNANYDATGTPSANDFEIWIDDVSFIK